MAEREYVFTFRSSKSESSTHPDLLAAVQRTTKSEIVEWDLTPIGKNRYELWFAVSSRGRLPNKTRLCGALRNAVGDRRAKCK